MATVAWSAQRVWASCTAVTSGLTDVTYDVMFFFASPLAYRENRCNSTSKSRNISTSITSVLGQIWTQALQNKKPRSCYPHLTCRGQQVLEVHICNYVVCYCLRETDHLGDPGVDGRIILRWIFRKWNGGGMDWIELAQDGDKWRTLVNAVMNFRVP
jgi:hypothetical protein